MKISCPNCNQRLDIADKLAGRKIKCPVCKSNFILQIPELSPSKNKVINKLKTRGNIYFEISLFNISLFSMSIALFYFTYTFYQDYSAQKKLTQKAEAKFKELDAEYTVFKSELEALK